MAFSNVMKIPVRNNKWSEMNGKLSIPLLLCLLPVGVVAQQPHINSADSVRSLGEVIVTGSRTPRPVNSSPVTTQLLSGKVMRDAGFGDFQSALQHLTPGLNVQKVAFGSEMSMDGMDARHVVMLQDGERMTGDMAGNLDYERFNIHGIDRVEVVKGASSTLYGSRASGAVINVIGKKTHKPLDIDVGVRWGQMNERNYRNPKKKDFIYMFERMPTVPTSRRGSQRVHTRAGSRRRPMCGIVPQMPSIFIRKWAIARCTRAKLIHGCTKTLCCKAPSLARRWASRAGNI